MRAQRNDRGTVGLERTDRERRDVGRHRGTSVSLSSEQRSRIVKQAFDSAGQRLKTCALPKSAPAPGGGPTENLSDDWAAAKPKITETRLRGNPELVDSTMDLVFRIERQTSVFCGTPTGEDLALVLIAKLHEGM